MHTHSKSHCRRASRLAHSLAPTESRIVPQINIPYFDAMKAGAEAAATRRRFHISGPVDATLSTRCRSSRI